VTAHPVTAHPVTAHPVTAHPRERLGLVDVVEDQSGRGPLGAREHQDEQLVVRRRGVTEPADQDSSSGGAGCAQRAPPVIIGRWLLRSACRAATCR
jgi:hypothetical protein